MRDGLMKLLVAAAVGIGVSTALAQPDPATAPSSPPTTPPAAEPNGSSMPPLTPAPGTAPVVPINTSTPRGTLKSLLTAIQDGDAQRIQQLIAITSPIEQKMVDALSKRAASDKNFRDAAVSKFGADAAKALVGDTDANNAINMSQLDAAEEKIDGESAVVSSGGASEPIKLQRVDDNWKIPASEFTKDTDQAGVEERVKEMTFAAELIDQAAKDVASGKWKTVDEAGEAIQTQIRDAMMRRMTTPSTGPTMPDPTDPTDPTTQPR